MKKIIILSCLMLFSMICMAQGHLKFKGIPIDGTLEKCTQKMKAAGMELLDTGEGVSFFSSDFAGYKKCSIAITTQEKRDLVNHVVVVFPKCDVWSKLSDNYTAIKSMLTEKYGEPSDCSEKFDGNREPTDDFKKMIDVKMDRCKYSCKFQTEEGTIGLEIAHTDMETCFVALHYYDKINSEVVRKDAMDDL